MTTTLVTEIARTSTIVDSDGTTLIIDERGTTSVYPSQMGPQGPRGDAGPASAFYLHTQSSTSATWTINHNLGFQPTVSIKTAGGAEVECDVIHTSNNQCIAYANSAFSGTARCS